MIGTSRSTNGIRTRRPTSAAIAIVVGMDRDGGVAEDRLGPRRRDRDRLVRVRLAGRLVDQVVADRPERARLGRRDHLEVADARPAARAPVDERLGRDRRGRRRRAVVNATRTAFAEPSSIVKRRRPQSSDAAEPPLLAEHDLAGLVDERLHPLEVALAPERLRGSRPPSAMIRSRTNWAAIEAWSRPGRNSVGRPCIRAWRIIRSSTVVRWAWPRCSEPVMFGGGWMIVNGVSDRVGARARAVRREDVGRQPALVDRGLEVGRPVGLRAARSSICVVGRRRSSVVSPEIKRPARPADERGRGTTCWFGVRAGPLIAAGRVRRPRRRAIGRRPHGSRVTFTPPCPRGSHRPALAPWPFGRYSSRSLAVRRGV